MRPRCPLVLKKSVADCGWVVEVPLGTIEKMIGEKHFLMLSSRIEYLILIEYSLLKCVQFKNCFIKNLRYGKRKKV